MEILQSAPPRRAQKLFHAVENGWDERYQTDFGQPPLADAWAQFLTERPVEYFRDGRAESIGEDEWISILEAMKTLKFNFEDYDEYTAPSLLSDFKYWLAAKKPADDVTDKTAGGADEASGVW